MKIRTIRKTLLGSAIALAAGTAFAQQTPDAENLLSQYDQNNSESLSLAEFQDLYRDQASNQTDNIADKAKQLFEKADNDGNDALAMSELRRALPLDQDMNKQSNERSTASSDQSADPQSNTQTDSNAQTASTQSSTSNSQNAETQTRINSAESHAELSSAVAAQADVNPDSWEREERNEERTDDLYERNESVFDRSNSWADDQPNSLEMMARQQPDELEGWEIENSQDEDMGEIEDVLRHSESGDLYALISTGGFIGFGENEAVVPLSALERSQEEDDELIFTGQSHELQEYEESQYEILNAETAQLDREERRTEIASQQ